MLWNHETRRKRKALGTGFGWQAWGIAWVSGAPLTKATDKIIRILEAMLILDVLVDTLESSFEAWLRRCHILSIDVLRYRPTDIGAVGKSQFKGLVDARVCRIPYL